MLIGSEDHVKDAAFERCGSMVDLAPRRWIWGMAALGGTAADVRTARVSRYRGLWHAGPGMLELFA